MDESTSGGGGGGGGWLGGGGVQGGDVKRGITGGEEVKERKWRG